MSRILLVDDNAPLREMLSHSLANVGHDVQEAMDGVMALQLCQRTLPDVLVTDILMPEKDGLETIKEVRQHYPSVKIIAISGGGRIGSGEYLLMAKAMGAAIALAKPFTPPTLLDAIAKVLR